MVGPTKKEEAMSFEAKYPGTCWVCEEAINPGQQIEGSAYGWGHVKCPEPPAREVCQKCFQEKAANGSCACD